MRPRDTLSVFQPICGIFSCGSSGVMRSTSPAIQPSPSVTSYSRPRSAISCMPTQMPKNGRPLLRTASSSASTMPSTASRPRRQSAKAPTPGSTTRSARATHGRVVGHHDRLIEAGLMRRALERLGGRVQIAGAVIDDGDAHRGAPGSGNRPMMPARQMRAALEAVERRRARRRGGRSLDALLARG